MIFKQLKLLNVYYNKGAEKILMGRLALKERRIFFQYDPSFIQTNLELSPFKLPLQSGVIPCLNSPFEGLFGIFNDSLPDGWGRLLLDRKLIHLGVIPEELTPLDRLSYVGRQGMGALTYAPAMEENISSYHENLDQIADEIVKFLETDADQYVDHLFTLNGSSGGARPKIIVQIEQDSQIINKQNLTLFQGNWLIKFPSSSDPKDIGLVEYAYHLMALNAGLMLPEARLFKSKTGLGYFGVKLFDRTENNRFHMHTVSGLLHADHRIPSLDYTSILKATSLLTKDTKECEKIFRHAVFNVLSHNRDDHGKNFSYLMDETGRWKVSPCYDLTFSTGPAGEHCTMVAGEGKKPTLHHLLKLSEISGMHKKLALEIIDQVKNAT